MKTRQGSLVIIAFTLVFALAGATSARAELSFAGMDGTWWKTTKQLDTGYLFPPVTDDGTQVKAKKYKNKEKPGYMFVPAGSFDETTSTYDDVVLIDYDKATKIWLVSSPYAFVVHGGTPNDFVGHTDGSEPPEEGVTMALTVRVTLTEDKKNPGTIKAGQLRTLGSSLLMKIPAVVTFAGKTDFRAKWIPASKVPDDVMSAVIP